MNQYTDIILEKGREVHVLIKSSKIFSNIPSQYHDHTIIGIAAFVIIVLPVLVSLVFRGSKKSNINNKQIVKYGSSPMKSPIKSPMKSPNKSPNNKNNKTPMKSPNNKNNNNNTPTPSKKQLAKYQYPDQSLDYEDNSIDFEDNKSPLKLEAPKSDKKSKTPKKAKFIVFSPPKNQTRARVPPERLVIGEKQQTQRRKSTK